MTPLHPRTVELRRESGVWRYVVYAWTRDDEGGARRRKEATFETLDAVLQTAVLRDGAGLRIGSPIAYRNRPCPGCGGS